MSNSRKRAGAGSSAGGVTVSWIRPSRSPSARSMAIRTDASSLLRAWSRAIWIHGQNAGAPSPSQQRPQCTTAPLPRPRRRIPPRAVSFPMPGSPVTTIEPAASEVSSAAPELGATADEGPARCGRGRGRTWAEGGHRRRSEPEYGRRREPEQAYSAGLPRETSGLAGAHFPRELQPLRGSRPAKRDPSAIDGGAKPSTYHSDMRGRASRLALAAASRFSLGTHSVQRFPQ